METTQFLLRLMLQFSQNLRLIVTQKTGFDESRQNFQIHMTDLVKVGCLIVNGIHTLLHPVIRVCCVHPTKPENATFGRIVSYSRENRSYLYTQGKYYCTFNIVDQIMSKWCLFCRYQAPGSYNEFWKSASNEAADNEMQKKTSHGRGSGGGSNYNKRQKKRKNDFQKSQGEKQDNQKMKKDNENLKVNKTSWCYVDSTRFSSPDLYQKCQMKYCYHFASDVCKLLTFQSISHKRLAQSGFDTNFQGLVIKIKF